MPHPPDISASHAAALDLLASMVSQPSVSGDEAPLAAFMAEWLHQAGAEVELRERNVIARVGPGGRPRVLLNSHLDTVPPGEQWTREPWQPTVAAGRLYGLGSNDAKASGACMAVAVAQLAAAGYSPTVCGNSGRVQGEVVLALTCEEERGRAGLEAILPSLGEFDACIIGEPTSLQVVRAQKGLLIAEIITSGEEVHAAHATRLGAGNAILRMGEVLRTLAELPPYPDHPLLGGTTLTPTVIRGGEARNRTPAAVSLFLDCRTTPAVPHETILADLARVLPQAEVRGFSNRLHPFETAENAPLVRLATRLTGVGEAIGSATMSDAAHCRRFPTIKVGPGDTLLSHQPDEYIELRWLAPAVEFYRELCEGLLSQVR